MKKILFLLVASLTTFLYGCADKGEDSVDFTYAQDAKDPRVYHFKASGNSDFGEFKYTWNFPNGNKDTGAEATFQFVTYGKQTVTLEADIETSNVHTTVTKEITVDVPKIENIDFSFTRDKQHALTAQFQAKSKSDYNVVYEWDFGDGKVKQGAFQEIIFDNFGKKTINLTAKIPELDYQITIDKMIDLATPIISNVNLNYYPDKKEGLDVFFTSSAETDFGVLEYEWDFGRGVKKPGQEANYVFQRYDVYPVKLKVSVKDTNISQIISTNVDVTSDIGLDFTCNYVDIRDNMDNFLKTQCIPRLTKELESPSFKWTVTESKDDIKVIEGKDLSYQFTTSDLYEIKVCVDSKQVTEPLCKTKKIPVIEKPVPSLKFDRGKYWMQDGKDTRKWTVTIDNVWYNLNLLNTINVDVTTNNVHVGCYEGADIGLNNHVLHINNYGLGTIFSKDCYAEKDPIRGHQNVKYSIKKDNELFKEVLFNF